MPRRSTLTLCVVVIVALALAGASWLHPARATGPAPAGHAEVAVETAPEPQAPTLLSVMGQEATAPVPARLHEARSSPAEPGLDRLGPPTARRGADRGVPTSPGPPGGPARGCFSTGCERAPPAARAVVIGR